MCDHGSDEGATVSLNRNNPHVACYPPIEPRQDEHDVDHIAGSRNISRGLLEMNIEQAIPDLDAVILCYCNANNKGALSADTLRAMGYRNARFIAGGLKAYRARN